MFGFVCLRGRAQVLLAAVGLVGLSSASHAITLDDITVWTGSGDSRAGLVIDWADGSGPAVFGYRFDGSPTGEDMFKAIATDRPELFIKTGEFEFRNGEGVVTFSGTAIFGVGLDRDNDGFAIDDGSVFTNGQNVLTPTQVNNNQADGAASTDSGDTYREAWNTGYWAYYNADDLGQWGFANFGFTDRQLSDGDWDGWTYAANYAANEPSVQVPEPTSAVLLGLAGAVLIRRRRSA